VLSKYWQTALGAKLCTTFLAIVVSLSPSPLRADEIAKAFQLFNAERYDEAFPLFLELAQDGNPEAQGTVARMFGNGWGTKKNEEKSYYWASRGALKNNATSQHVIGYIHWYGLAGFKRNLDEAILWTEKAAEQNNEKAICNLLEIYSEATHLPDYETRIRNWYKKGAELRSPCAWAFWGDTLTWGLHGEKKNHKKAAELLEKSAELGVGRGSAGWIFAFGDESVRDRDKALKYLNSEATENPDSFDAAYATYLLAKGYLFGDSAIETDRESGYSLLKKLTETKFKYFAYELESQIYARGIDRPSNTQRAILTALKGMQLELDEAVVEGTIAGRYILENDILLDAGLPDYLELAWYRFHVGPQDSQGLYDQYKSGLSKELVNRSEKFTHAELLQKTLEFFEDRRASIGPIEPIDLINESIAQFDGERGLINEPLAQLLAEEGLRLAIRVKDYELQQEARNVLGVIFYLSANKHIRNIRLANVHLYDGRDSWFGPRNILWLNYLGLISLTKEELKTYQEAYLEREGSKHRTESLTLLSQHQRGNQEEAVAFLEKAYVAGDTELAGQIGFMIQSLASNKEDYARALEWFKLAESNEAERVKKIIDGNFVRDMPRFTGTVNQLFEVDLVETRGGLLTDLKSAIAPSAGSKPKKSNKVLSLHALVIGNGDYKTKPLSNSRNDAKSIAQKLRSLGFEVMEGTDLTRGGFRDMLIRFTERAKDADVTIFYYAGHGMQLGGINYLLPTDVDFSMSQEVVTFDGISLNELKNRHLPGETRLLFLDACRNNPFRSNTRGANEGGLAPVNVGTGTLISFATRDGSVALDGVGGTHSPYTLGLLKYIDSKEDVELMLRAVGDEVMRLTNNFQQPWKYGALSGDKVIISELGKRSRR
jgi:TPR repeat protein